MEDSAATDGGATPWRIVAITRFGVWDPRRLVDPGGVLDPVEDLDHRVDARDPEHLDLVSRQPGDPEFDADPGEVLLEVQEVSDAGTAQEVQCCAIDDDDLGAGPELVVGLHDERLAAEVVEPLVGLEDEDPGVGLEGSHFHTPNIPADRSQSIPRGGVECPNSCNNPLHRV